MKLSIEIFKDIKYQRFKQPIGYENGVSYVFVHA